MKSKILLVGWGYPPNIDGGLDIHVKHLFEELQRKDVDVTLALPEERAPDRKDIIGIETGDGDMIWKARKMSSEIAQLAEEYDIIHTHDWFGAEAGFKAKKYGSCKWISTLHSLSSGRSRCPSGRLQRIEEVAVENSDLLIAVSNQLANEIENEFGRTPEVLHNGFSSSKKSGIEVKDNLEIDEDMIFFVGRHSEQKGIEHLLYGFKKLLQEREAELVIGGEGHMTQALKEFSEMLNIDEKVHFQGFIPERELGDYYHEADVFVSPSINEPFGLTITEALESGTPVVATENGVEELVSNGIISVEPDSDSISSGISRALSQKPKVDYQNRSWEDMAEDILDIYSRALLD